jgi:hypothetical protein
VSEISVEEHAIAGILCQREAEPVCCGAVERPSRSNPGSIFALQTKYSWCESESEFKKEIPVEMFS